MKNIFAIFFIFFAVTSQAQMKASDRACIKALSKGQNRLKLKMNARALIQLFDGLQTYHNYLEEHTSALLVDYTLSSRVKRAFLVDFKSCDILESEYALHGGSTYAADGTVLTSEADLNHDGILDRCINSKGTRHNMTRPGFSITAGCHPTKKKGWTDIGNCYGGIKLIGMNETNKDEFLSGVVLHEHASVDADNSIKYESQGCPAFVPGRLKALMQYGIAKNFLVFLYAPQCNQ